MSLIWLAYSTGSFTCGNSFNVDQAMIYQKGFSQRSDATKSETSQQTCLQRFAMTLLLSHYYTLWIEKLYSEKQQLIMHWWWGLTWCICKRGQAACTAYNFLHTVRVFTQTHILTCSLLYLQYIGTINVTRNKGMSKRSWKWKFYTSRLFLHWWYGSWSIYIL